jgi:oxazoline/thiazoline synthase
VLLRPELRRNLHVEVVQNEGVCLIDGNGARVFTDRRYLALLPLIDGVRSAHDIADQLEGVIPTAEVYFALLHLEDSGYIVEAGDFGECTMAEETAFLSGSPAAFAANTSAVFIVVDNLTSHVNFANRLVTSLSEAGLRVGVNIPADAMPRVLRVAIVEDYLSDAVACYHEARKQDGSDWILIKPVGLTAWVGPILGEARSVCWACLAQRLRENRLVEAYLQREFGRVVSSTEPLFPAVENVAVAMLVGLVINNYSQDRQLENHTLLQFDIREIAITRHPVVPLDTCSTCTETRTNDELRLVSRRKVYTTDGGYRSVHPSETLHHESRLVSPHTGIISRLFELEDSSPLMPVFLARHNFGYRPSKLVSTADNLANTSAGKGRSVAQARASALCEAAERHSVFFQGYETIVSGTSRSLGSAVIHPNDCMLYSEHQYATRDEWNRSAPWSLHVPEPLSQSDEIDWSPVWSLTENRRKFLPTAYLYHTPHVASVSRGRKFCFSDSNGNAAGNNLEEAVLQGFLELVERDAVAVWWYNRIVRPIVNLSELDDPYIFSLLSQYESIDRRVWVLDITHDFGIPVYVALSSLIDVDQSTPGDDILTGFGAHLDPKIAISRALTELSQMLPRARRESRNRVDEETADWFRRVTLEKAAFLAGTGTPIRLSKRVGPQSDDLLDDITYCEQLVQKLGMEFLVLDQTRRETGLSCVKVIVPGMRHYWRRLAPGRLYDVPVRLGWFSSKLQEDELNTLAMLG